EVAVDLAVGLGDLGLDAGEFGLLCVVPGVVLALGFGHGVGDERVVVAVEARECVEHGLLAGGGREAVSVAFGGVVAGAGEAAGVVVGLVLAGGAGADPGVAAFRAAHESGEWVGGAVGAAVGGVLAAFGEEALCFFEGLGVD